MISRSLSVRLMRLISVTAAYEVFGWVTDKDGNKIDIYDEDGNALYPECIKESK